nr:hypothetical protein [Tanacetum cinerariifolium]
MAKLAFCDYHNMIAILEKTNHNTDFHEIVDFLEASHIRIETTNQKTKILATDDGKSRTISESSLRRHLKLSDKERISSLPKAELFENLSLMGYNILPNQSLDAGQDRENINKTSAFPHESSPRVTSLDADEGSMQQRLHELMELCTSLQRQQSHMAAKIKDQDLEISRLKARGIIEIGAKLGTEKSTELGSNDTEEMVNVLSSMEAANILTSGVEAASVSPASGVSAAGVPTVSGSFPTVSAIVTTSSVVTPYTRRPRGIEGFIITQLHKKGNEDLSPKIARKDKEKIKN